MQKNINLSPTHSGADIHVQKQLNVKAGLYIGPEMIFRRREITCGNYPWEELMSFLIANGGCASLTHPTEIPNA
ncbi:TPA: hypothetical protein JD203_08275 [Cronobacter sakazakii]|nr:hypothetical protein [Cronobacter sakazakii]EGT5652942.1 hypothetical protein [Cronobacter sakazakii]EGT5749385.1 hypothetical protein [Cronobacter sakazakii]EGT5753699.1 hypothetical protein [Cronobacter sakazakii]KAB0829236.1 hypothetical protein FZI24_00575 [Cronobacter sakazakii]